MRSMMWKAAGYAAAMAVARYLLGGSLVSLLEGETVSDSWILPYMRLAGPDFLSRVFAGAALPVLFAPNELFEATLLSLMGVVAVHLAIGLLFESFDASSWMGYAILTAPFMGSAFGIAAGAVIGALMKSLLVARRT
jgi:hypothetical protein